MIDLGCVGAQRSIRKGDKAGMDLTTEQMRSLVSEVRRLAGYYHRKMGNAFNIGTDRDELVGEGLLALAQVVTDYEYELLPFDELRHLVKRAASFRMIGRLRKVFGVTYGGQAVHVQMHYEYAGQDASHDVEKLPGKPAPELIGWESVVDSPYEHVAVNDLVDRLYDAAMALGAQHVRVLDVIIDASDENMSAQQQADSADLSIHRFRQTRDAIRDAANALLGRD